MNEGAKVNIAIAAPPRLDPLLAIAVEYRVDVIFGLGDADVARARRIGDPQDAGHPRRIGAERVDDPRGALRRDDARYRPHIAAAGADRRDPRAAVDARVQRGRILIGFGDDHDLRLGIVRSEEHTSELQSLMRLSYDVF